MAEYKSDGPIENEQYCMGSWQKRNVESMNQKMGYHNMADRANAAHPPTAPRAAKSNPQLSPKSSNNNYDY